MMTEDILLQIDQLNQQTVRLYHKGQYQKALEIALHASNLASKHLDETEQECLDSLNNLALLHQTLGNYSIAETLYEKTLKLTRKLLGEQHPSVAFILNNQALLYEAIGNYEQALSSYQQVIEIWRTNLEETHSNFITALNNQAGLLKTMGNYAEAEKLYLKVLEIRRQTLGEEDSSFANSQNNLALLYQEMGDYAKAEFLYQQVLHTWNKNLGKEHPQLAIANNNLATLYQERGNYAEAKKLYLKSLESRRKVLGDIHPGVAESLGNLASLCQAEGNYLEAKKFYEQSLEIIRVAEGENNPNFAIASNNLAGLYQEIGEYNQAQHFYQKSLDIRQKIWGEFHVSVATSLHNFAAFYYAIGNYAEAEPLYQKAIEIIGKVLGKKHPSFATSLNNLAMLYKAIGKYAAAEKLYKQVLEIQHQVLGQIHPDIANSLNNQASLYYEMGNYATAEPLYQQALEICRQTQGEKHPDFATSLNNLAVLYFRIANYKAAEPLYQQALAIRRQFLGEKHPDLATNLNNLALVHQAKENYLNAEKLYQQTIEIQSKTWGENHPYFAIALGNMARLYSNIDDYNAAEKNYQQAIKIWENNSAENHSGFATTLNELASLYHGKENYEAAEELYQRALKIRQQLLGVNHPDIASTLHNLAFLYAQTNRDIDAINIAQRAEAINDNTIGQVFSISSEIQRMIYIKALQSNFEGFLSLIFQYRTRTVAEVGLGLDIICRRKGLGSEALAAQRDAVVGGRYPNLAPKLEKLKTLRMQIARKSLAGPDLETVEAHQQFLREWNTQKEALETELARQIPELNLAEKLQAANRQAIALALPVGTVLIEFICIDIFDFKAISSRGESNWKSARYLGFVLRAKEPDSCQIIDLGEAEEINKKIAKFLASITGKTNNREFENVQNQTESRREFEAVPMVLISEAASVGVELRKKIFDPLVAAIGDRLQILLAPDGDLTKLPFEVLPTDDDRRLIDDYQISYLSTGRDILRFGSKSSGKPTDPVVAADPDFDLSGTGVTIPEEIASPRGRQSRDLDSRELNFKRLTYTETEGKQIAAQLGVKPWLGGEVLESQLKAIRSPRILHLATHGFFLPNQKQDPNTENLALMGNQMGRLSGQGLENPLLRSGLALAGANTWLKKGSLPPEAEDGILTAEDVSGLDLLDTELVVLSACQTGLGEVQTGEGVFGLRRAFVLAGAKTLVMSLWKVPDKQTQELMTDYYRRILAGEPRGDALRSAQLEMKKKYPNPYYWGAFICQGDPSCLPQEKAA